MAENEEYTPINWMRPEFSFITADGLITYQSGNDLWVDGMTPEELDTALKNERARLISEYSIVEINTQIDPI